MLHKALWDGLDIERIRTATDPQASADLAVLLITVGGWVDEGGLVVQCRGVCLGLAGDTCMLQQQGYPLVLQVGSGVTRSQCSSVCVSGRRAARQLL